MEEKHNSPATGTGSPPAGSAEPQSSRRRGGVLKRKASSLSNSNTSTPPASSSLKRQAREKPSPVLFPPIHNGPCTRARQQPNYADSATFWDAVVVNGDGEGSALPMPVAAKVEEELIARKEAWEALEAKLEAEYDTVKSRDASAHVVPISSGWFSWTKVHPLEEKSLPNFFNKKSEDRTPEIYMEIRNAIMNRFHANPNKQIEVKDLTDISIGELEAKQEVMEFLDYWGLINYHPFPEADATSSVVDADEVAKVNSLIKKLYEFETEHLCSLAASKPSVATPTVQSRLPESMVTEESMEPEGPSVEYHCNSCSADCSRKRYHCQKQADFDLCTECFNGRKFDSDMSPSDFILMEPADAAGASGGKWTDQETLLLLEALELFSENWNEIAEHVATKTKAQCILHFVQMPIEDTFLDCDDEDNATHKENAGRKIVDAVQEENGDEKEVDATLKKENEAAAAIKTDVPSDDAPVMKETKDPKALLNNDSSPPNDDPSNNDQPNSSPMEISESVEPKKLKDNQERGANIAVKALREAFEAVGSLPSPEEKFSFADAGNPVMALAAFLGRLVEPNIATASARASLKSLSNGGTGLQLSARHSFIIQHPDDEKKLDDNADFDRKEKEDKSSMIDSNGKSIDCDDKEDTNSTKEEKESLVSLEKDKDSATEEVAPCNSLEKDTEFSEEKLHSSPNDGSREKSGGATATDLVTTDEIKTSPPIDSNSLKLQKEQEPSTAGEISEQTCQIEDPSSSKKESEDFPDPPEASKGDTEAKDGKNEKKCSLETKDDPSTHNLKRAAVTAISAAAVKAKFLADQEENQIRQLATSLIEKQLHKLETKLTFFTDMDNVVGRVREQLERSKQRLYHERAQIIAAKLGMSSAASTRPIMPPSLQNRPPMAFPRPQNPMSMTPQRPPFSRPPGMNPTAPSSVAGNSPVGMK